MEKEKWRNEKLGMDVGGGREERERRRGLQHRRKEREEGAKERKGKGRKRRGSRSHAGIRRRRGEKEIRRA